MRVKVDEDLPVAVGDVVRQKGHEATSVREQGMGGWSPDQGSAVDRNTKRL